MTDVQPLTDDEYRQFMRWAIVGRHLGDSGELWAEELWNRHAATVSQDDVRRAATHEAGHAVVAHASGLRVLKVVLHDNGEGCTYTETPSEGGPLDELVNALHIAMFKLAGSVAEEIEWGRARYPDRDVVGAVMEHFRRRELTLLALRANDVEAVLPGHSGSTIADTVVALVEQGAHMARLVLRRNRCATQRLADAFLGHGSLGATQMSDLLSEVLLGDGRNAGT